MFEQYITNPYLRAFVIFILVFLGIRIALFILEKISLKITSKTKTELDDKLLKKCSMPLTIIAFLISLRITISEVLFQEHVEMVLANTISSLLVIVLAITGIVYTIRMKRVQQFSEFFYKRFILTNKSVRISRIN